MVDLGGDGVSGGRTTCSLPDASSTGEDSCANVTRFYYNEAKNISDLSLGELRRSQTFTAIFDSEE